MEPFLKKNWHKSTGAAGTHCTTTALSHSQDPCGSCSFREMEWPDLSYCHVVAHTMSSQIFSNVHWLLCILSIIYEQNHKEVSQDPLKGPSIGLMHMMAVQGKQWLFAHGTAVSCTQTNGLRGNKECLFTVSQNWSKVQQEQTKKANTHTQTQTENLCQMKTNDGKGNSVSNSALQSSLEHTSLDVVASAILLPIPSCCSYPSIHAGLNWTFSLFGLSMVMKLKCYLELSQKQLCTVTKHTLYVQNNNNKKTIIATTITFLLFYG